MNSYIMHTRLIVLTGLIALVNGSVSGQSASTASTSVTAPAETSNNHFEREGAVFDRQAAVFAKQAAETDKQLAQVQSELLKARAAEASEGTSGTPRAGGGGFGGSGTFFSDQNGIVGFYGGGRTSGGTLIIPKEATPKVLSETEEDLNVMARILEKALGHDENRAMGIVIRDSILGASSNLRNLYIEGYGALFLLNVNFPLLPPPAEKSDNQPNEETNTEWDQARREVYGSPGTPPGFQERMRVVIGGSDSTEPYDANRVEELKRDLTGALKNASHIRGLKPDEMVTVVVSGRGASGSASAPKEIAGSRRASTSSASNIRNTRLTISARKSDVDAFQKGVLDAPGFEKKVSVTVY